MEERFDFSGWATRNDIKCADGRTIRRDAFKDCDGKTVPLVWGHIHDDPNVVLGHGLLKNDPKGVRIYGVFNDTEAGRNAKAFVKNGDVTSLSIYANKLKQRGGDVIHGVIREVSLVLAGANPGAYIEEVNLAHGDDPDSATEAIIWNDDGVIDPNDIIVHSFDGESDKNEETKEETIEHSEDSEGEKEGKEMADKTIKDVVDSMNEEQKKVLYFLVGKAAEGNGETDDEDDEAKHYDDDEGEEVMKHNVFDKSYDEGPTLSHDQMEEIIKDGKKYGSLKESFLAHAEEYGIDGLEWLFPEDRNVNGNTPEWIKRDMDWVSSVMGAVHHTPFSRVKSTFANITEDEARAKGYIKGNYKKEEVFSLLKRATHPQTVYKKQKLDRDDKIDITDFDVVAWLKGEMRMMLNEEIARAILIGDGRIPGDEYKINEDNIRPIANDADLFTIKKAVTVGNDDDATAKNFIRAAIKARKDYKGSGNPVLFTTEDMLTDMLLLEDNIGHSLYPTEATLATKLRVSKIVTVPVMENHQVGGRDLMGIIVNMNDYTVGADKGGAVEMFEDFDIDYNQEKYLIETRCSGALTKPFSAIVLFKGGVPSSVDGDVKKSKTEYIEVTPTSGANPATSGWYVRNAVGKYVRTTDTEVVSGTTYYQRVSHIDD